MCARADVLVAAVGVPRLLGADAVKPGAAVIDVGINRLPEGLCGDVDFDAVREVAGLLTPVPGGVGPMTDRDAAAQHAFRRAAPISALTTADIATVATNQPARHSVARRHAS